MKKFDSIGLGHAVQDCVENYIRRSHTLGNKPPSRRQIAYTLLLLAAVWDREEGSEEDFRDGAVLAYREATRALSS